MNIVSNSNTIEEIQCNLSPDQKNAIIKEDGGLVGGAENIYSRLYNQSRNQVSH
jgi:hypothetical protein